MKTYVGCELVFRGFGNLLRVVPKRLVMVPPGHVRTSHEIFDNVLGLYISNQLSLDAVCVFCVTHCRPFFRSDPSC